MKKILISIKPKWTAKILNGEKTLEIRKSFPKCELPCEVYIYCTKDKNELRLFDKEIYEQFKGSDRARAYSLAQQKYYTALIDKKSVPCNGKVVAKFTLNKAEEIENDRLWEIDKDFLERTCLSFGELASYLSSKTGYAWHIDNLEIFDKPKELKEFKHPCKHKELDCEECVKLHIEGSLKDKPKCHYGTSIEHAPQSWCYCEVEE